MRIKTHRQPYLSIRIGKPQVFTLRVSRQCNNFDIVCLSVSISEFSKTNGENPVRIDCTVLRNVDGRQCTGY